MTGSTPPHLLRYAAFAERADGGNPAGVVLDAGGLDAAQMLALAAEVGYSETAFVVGGEGGTLDVRYFSPQAEVPFCGHATIATAVAWAERHGPGELLFRTAAGPVPITVGGAARGAARFAATLTTVPPEVRPVAPADLERALRALGWAFADLDPGLPPRQAYAGAWHLVLAAGTRERLAELAYDFDALATLMAEHDWTTVQLVHDAGDGVYFSRNPFPPGGVVEDPATGAAAGAFGAYLRALELVRTPARVTIRQGDDLGRPGVIAVDIPAEPGAGIRVSGTAVRMDDPGA